MHRLAQAGHLRDLPGDADSDRDDHPDVVVVELEAPFHTDTDPFGQQGPGRVGVAGGGVRDHSEGSRDAGP